MSELPTDVILKYAGSDYDDLPADVKAMVDAAEADLGRVGVNVADEMSATEGAEAPVEAPASVTVTRDKSVPSSFGSRTAARAYVSDNPGYKVVDNGAGSENRWTVSAKGGSTTTGVRGKTKKARTATATATVTPAAAEKAPGKKDVARQIYQELVTASPDGKVKRATFLSECETRAGLSAKGASSYLYRFKGGKW